MSAPVATMTPMAPPAPAMPGLNPAPSAAVAQTPAPVVDLDSLAVRITASADPAALLAQLVQAVAATAPSAARQGLMLSTVKGTCDSTLKLVRNALLDAVGEQPGNYDGFTITSRAGSRTISYDKLQTRYPDVYSELVTVGDPSLTVKYTG